MTYQAQFRAALLHWRYAEISFGSAEDAVIRTRSPALDGLAASLLRNPDDPSHGMRLVVYSPRIPVSVCRGGYGRFDPVAMNEEVRLQGSGNRVRFGVDHQVELPPPCTPVGRFDGRIRPTSPEIIAVLGLEPAELKEPDLVKHRYRELVRRLHPDRSVDNEGHASRFLEVQACWDRYKELGLDKV
jgi:hypothetical protein